ncbi:hypothetical protein MBO12_03260 [Candidatus Saccharibacteria bacterium]|nr:hypothetical protein [Candidatus Saccharibacteria bacterium]
MRTKEDAKMTATSANLTKSSKPKRRGKRLLIICGILAVVAVVILISLAIVGGKHFGSSSNYRPNSPEDIMVRYLRDKYGKDFKLVGEMRRERGSTQREHYYESDAYPIDDPRLRFRVVLDGDNKEHKYEKSDTYLEAGRVLAEEDRLQPYAERIFGKNTKIGVEFRLCERGAAGMKGMVGLPEVMSICKEETADMTKEEIIDSSLYNDSGLSHDYSVYIYALDGQSVKTNGDKAKIIERLKKMVKYLPDGRSDSIWLCYFIKQHKSSGWSSELKVSVDDLRQMTDSFSDDLLKPIVPDDGGVNPYPIRKGWDK